MKNLCRLALLRQATNVSHIHLQRRDKRLLGDIHLPVLTHLLLAFLLLQMFALTLGIVDNY